MANTVTIIKQPLYGTVVWNGSNFVYTPHVQFVGRDFYIYTIDDGEGNLQTLTNYADTANVAISATNISLTADANEILTINLDDYVTDDTLIYPYKITQITKPLLGSIRYSDRTIKYESNGYDGVDIVYYTITDGQYDSTASITIKVQNGSNIAVPEYIREELNTVQYVLADVQTASADWQTTYTILCTNSSKWSGLDSDRYNTASNIVEANSSNWNNLVSASSAYDISVSIVSSNSAAWNYVKNNINTVYNIISTQSAIWDSSYVLLTASSADWNTSNTILTSVSSLFKANSSNWTSVYNIVNAQSSDWDKTIYLSILSTNSADWNNVYSELTANSGNWQDSYDSITDLVDEYNLSSGNWISTYNTVSTNSAKWGDQTALSILTGSSANWNAVASGKDLYDSSYSTVCTNSADWNYVKDNFLPVSNEISSNSANWNNTYSVVCGNSAKWDTAVTNFEIISTNVTNNSANWDTAFTTVTTNSAEWTIAYTSLTTNSANWNAVASGKDLYDSSYSTVCTNSADWNYVKDNFTFVLTAVTANSANWDTSYNVVCSNSADWNNSVTQYQPISTEFSTNSSNWTSVYNTVCAKSGDWQNAYTSLSTNSANWNSTYNTVCAHSGKWQNSYSIVTGISASFSTNSAKWDTSYSIVCSNSATWNDKTLYSIVSTNSAKWNSVLSAKELFEGAVTVLSTNSAKWNSLTDNFSFVLTTMSTKSANWNNTYNYVCANSANWQTKAAAVTTLSSEYEKSSGFWQSTYTTVNQYSGFWNSSQVISIVIENYNDWNTTYTLISNNSASWNTAKNNVTILTNNLNLSAPIWTNTYNTVSTNSATWGDIAGITQFSKVSGNYNLGFSTITSNSARWNDSSNIYLTLTTNSASWNNTTSLVINNSAVWNNANSVITSNSGRWLSGGNTIDFTTNTLTVCGNAVIYGPLTADGSITNTGTTSQITASAFYLQNEGNTDAFVVNKTTNQGALANFTSNGNSVLYISPNNRVGINTNNPNNALAVVGSISASGVIYGEFSPVYTAFSAKSANYEAAYNFATLSSTSINTLINAGSSYRTALTYVGGVSTNISNFFSKSSSTYDTAYAVVTTQSANLDTSYTFITTNSAKLGIDTQFRALSSRYETAYSFVAAATAALFTQINVVFDGGGDKIENGTYAIVSIPSDIKIENWVLLSDSTITTTYVDILCSDYANYPLFPNNVTPLLNTVIDYPKLQGSQKAPSFFMPLTNWNTNIKAGSYLKVIVSNNDFSGILTVSLKCKKQ